MSFHAPVGQRQGPDGSPAGLCSISHRRPSQQPRKNQDRDRILEIQGAIAELRRLSTLRDEVIKGAE
jgi:hypothetical protein